MDIAVWLQELGLERYAQAFLDNDIAPAVLPELTDQDLKDLGVSLGHRRLLLKSIQGLRDGPVGPPAPASAPPEPAIRPEAERRQLTVMFVDLVGSTALSARLDPEDMRAVIRAYQDTCAGLIVRFEGFVAKFMGDGVLAYFGWPQAHEDDAERAVRAGLALTEATARLSTPTGEALSARVGIATGLVVVGDLIGEGAAQEQAVVGDTPNLSARLQGLAAPGQVVIAEATRRLLDAGFELEDLGAQPLKGIALPIAAFAVTGERSTVSRFEAKSGPALLPMIGRDQELALLLERWTQAKAGEGQGVLLVAEAGIGKSRLTRALLDALADEPHARIRYQCSPYHADSALWPVIQQLTRAAGIATDDPTDARLDKLEALLDRAGGRETAPLIADLLGVDGAARYGPLDLTPLVQRARTMHALAEQLRGLAARQAVLVVLEDAHWIDPTTLELIEQCLDRIAEARVLILLTSRPDQQPALAAHPHVTGLTLNRLGRAGVESIVARLGGDHLPSETINGIIARTDGVPLFVEELTKAVLETGEASIPASLHDSLMARLDRIPDVKALAQIAACIGRDFDFSLLAGVADRREPELVSALNKLAAAELIFRRGIPPAATYSFKHALVQDAAYQSLLRSKRQQLHGRIAKFLEQRFPDTVEAEPELLAHHYTGAGLTAQAIAHWRKAGARAIERSANAEANADFDRGLELLKSLPESHDRAQLELQLLVPLGQAQSVTKGRGSPEAERTYVRAWELCQKVGEATQLFSVFFGLWGRRFVRAEFQAAEELLEQWSSLAERISDPGVLAATTEYMRGGIAYFRGQVVPARTHFEQVLAHHRPREHGSIAVRYGMYSEPALACGCWRAESLLLLGHGDQALAQSGASLALARQLGHPPSLASAVAWTAIFHSNSSRRAGGAGARRGDHRHRDRVGIPVSAGGREDHSGVGTDRRRRDDRGRGGTPRGDRRLACDGGGTLATMVARFAH